ncbi:hypothetical protein [Sulfurovum sp.]|uniref:hypothetical protein n=1 Tax=Sulfurovum sp. TaxID=1969726 RepID=UPI0025FDCA6F|nr:hypothetical protein [Sulfurovum sp.]
MAKIVFIFCMAFFSLWGENHVDEHLLQKACLSCHAQQQIPSEIIYRRYLLKYSSTSVIRQKIYAYLKAPSTQASIMPKPFFRKFPLKEPSELDDKTLQKLIDAYVDLYDVRMKIYVVPEKTD